MHAKASFSVVTHQITLWQAMMVAMMSKQMRGGNTPLGARGPKSALPRKQGQTSAHANNALLVFPRAKMPRNPLKAIAILQHSRMLPCAGGSAAPRPSNPPRGVTLGGMTVGTASAVDLNQPVDAQWQQAAKCGSVADLKRLLGQACQRLQAAALGSHVPCTKAHAPLLPMHKSS